VPEHKSEEEKIASLLKNAVRKVSASPVFKEILLFRLVREGQAQNGRKSRKFWSRPVVWAPAAAIVLALAFLISYAFTGWPGKPPVLVAPPPALSPSSPVIIPSPSVTEPPPPSSSVPPATPSGPAGSTVQPSSPAPSIEVVPPPASSAPPAPSTVTSPPPASSVPPAPSSPPLVASTGILKIMVTDAPPQADVSQINVLLSNVQVNINSVWLTVAPGPASFDLIELKGSVGALLGEATLDAGTYSQIRMDVQVIDAVINGERVDLGVNLPGGNLKLASSFDIMAGQTTVLTIDFDAADSLVFNGNGGVIFKPVVQLIVDYQ
jgi:hypothetical protein